MLCGCGDAGEASLAAAANPCSSKPSKKENTPERGGIMKQHVYSALSAAAAAHALDACSTLFLAENKRKGKV